MKKTGLDRFGLGPVPRVVGTLSKRRFLFSKDAPGTGECDIVEVRLDMIGASAHGWLDQCGNIEAAGWPVILTLRLAGEGGKWAGPDLAREPILCAAMENLSCVDVELNSRMFRPLRRKAEALGGRLIVSWHDFKRTPGHRELRNRLRKMLESPCVIPKIATMINGPEDVISLLKLLETEPDRPKCIIGMGDGGIRTRVVFPCMGSSLAYGYLDSPVAPGQISSCELVQFFRKLIPEYK